MGKRRRLFNLMTILLFYSSRAKSRTFECVKITVATHMTEMGVVMEVGRG